MRKLFFCVLAAGLLSVGAADKKKPVIKTTKTVQVGGAPKQTRSSPILGGFAALDKNGDGYLTRQEYGYNRQTSQALAEFDRLDTNKDGRISRSEYK
ncbi:MAG TPA: EF-hand domain-containing protein [Bryobacteraceae bacterium]|nr:EF-hand domain-containing protein [Bryobacteraceae bacterium]